MDMVPRPEYPRPQFVRAEWLNLNGTWDFTFDDDVVGLDEQWFDPNNWEQADPFNQSITVPFVYQSELSGIGCPAFHDVMWYRRAFEVPNSWRAPGQDILLNIGASDYRTTLWVNGTYAGSHEGGHTPFQANVTPYLLQGSRQWLVVRVEDVLSDLTQPRGKQYWKAQPEGIFYTPSSGIWQTVWLEPTPAYRLERVQFTPNVVTETVTIACYANTPEDGTVEATITFEGAPVTTIELTLSDGYGEAVVPLPNPRMWSPESPSCYHVTLRLPAPSQSEDRVQSYFGMRRVAIEDGVLTLNGEPYTMKLVLDQGYYRQGLLTAPGDEALRRDVELVKAMGFNGVRKHQKVEDPRYLYWADRLGLLVWGEMANCYRFSPAAMQRLLAEWQAVIERDYNHPSIVAWVPVNESWGVPNVKSDAAQVQFLLAVYHLTKALDATRPVIGNDGWEHVRSDLCTIHDYTGDAEEVKARYAMLDELLAFMPSKRALYVNDYCFEGQPILVTECGGIAFRVGDEQGWGYKDAGSAAELEESYRKLVTALLDAPLVQGFCYTQFTDVQQEVNGLLTYDREPKVPLATIRAINEGCNGAVVHSDAGKENHRQLARPELERQEA